MKFERLGKPTILYCTACMEKCTTVEETFDYSGTHCNNSKSGTHYTGNYVSECCLAEVTEEEPEEKKCINPYAQPIWRP